MIRKVIFGLIATTGLTFFSFSEGKERRISGEEKSLAAKTDSTKRKAELQRILNLLPADRISNGHVSFQDKTFQDWLKRTGELPPDFDKMPSIPLLPDPLLQEKNGQFLPITTQAAWKHKRQLLKNDLQYYMTGTYPAQPRNLDIEILNERKEGQVVIKMIRLKFGPDHAATLTVEMLIPPGKGPFPVFMTQWNHREWAQIAVKRGYVACIYAGADSKDDTEDYARIWPEKDFTRLMRRAYGSFVAVDYLYTLPFVDQKKIGITGHSRNGKLSLMAAAFDERITAVVTSSGGSGAEVPWRYAAHPYDVEDIALLTTAQPAWFHPRLRFFTGNENKLPVDQNSFMALIAPRGLLISTATTEGASNPWGAEQALGSAQKVYKFLNAEDQVAIRYRNGLHGTSAGDIESYIDFFDFIFKRSSEKPESKLLYGYTFEKWKQLSKEQINPLEYPKKNRDDMMEGKDKKTISTVGDWEKKKNAVLQKINWVMGDTPAIVKNPGPLTMENQGVGEDYFGSFLSRPKETSAMGIMKITPYKGFGDYLYGYLYYPKNKVKKGQASKLPVIIYLHEFDYSKGFSTIGYQHEIQPFFENLISQGYAVFAYDMIGFGNRIDEGTRFYQRYPHWSKMGKMVSDVHASVDALTNLDLIDSTKIFTAGYSLGATVGLYATATDQRIAGAVSVAGFTPMRTHVTAKGTEGIRTYSHLHGLLPRLGFFLGKEEHIPFDFHEVLASIAPRPLLIIAPEKDQNATLSDIQRATGEAKKVYKLYHQEQNVELFAPQDYNRFSNEMKEVIYQWSKKRYVKSE